MSEYVPVRFEAWMRRNTMQPNTISAYLQDVSQFHRWMDERSPDADLVDDYITDVMTTRSNATAARHLAAIKAWFQSINRKGELINIRSPKATKKTPRFFTQAEVIGIIGKSQSLIMKAAVALQFGAGLRFSELRRLDLTDLDFDNLTLAVETSKQGESRMKTLVPVSGNVLEIVAEYVNTRSDSNPGLFLRPGGSRLDLEQYNLHLKRICIGMGINPGTSHALRHAWGAHLTASGVDIGNVQDALRHASITSTQIYRHMDPEKLRTKLPEALPKTLDSGDLQVDP